MPKALERANFNKLYEKGIGISADEAGYFNHLYPVLFDIRENTISFLRLMPKESENLILLGSYSANDILQNDPVSLIRDLVNNGDQ